MVQQTNSCSNILYLFNKYSLKYSLFVQKYLLRYSFLVQETVHHIFLAYSVPADQFIVSIHSGEECLYQSVLGGRGEREKVGTEENLKHENGLHYIAYCTLQPIDNLHKGCTILLAMARQGGGLPLLCSLPKSLDRLQPSQGGIVSSEKEARRTFKVVYKSPIDGKPVQSHAFDA